VTDQATECPIPVVQAVELYTKVARYRTALVALVALVKRNGGGYMSWDDQNLLKQIDAILDEDAMR
jgi:hypothetical protein